MVRQFLHPSPEVCGHYHQHHDNCFPTKRNHPNEPGNYGTNLSACSRTQAHSLSNNLSGYGPWYCTGKHLHQKWTAMINPSTSALYIQKPHSIEVHCPVSSMYQFSYHHHPSCMPDHTVPVELNFTTNTNTILLFSTSTRHPPSPNPSTFFSYIHSLPQWEQLLLKWVQLHTDAFTVASQLGQSKNRWIAICDGSVQHSQASFGWVIAHTSGQRIAQCNRPMHGHKPTSYRSEDYGILFLLQFVLNLSTYTSNNPEALDNVHRP